MAYCIDIGGGGGGGGGADKLFPIGGGGGGGGIGIAPNLTIRIEKPTAHAKRTVRKAREENPKASREKPNIMGAIEISNVAILLTPMSPWVVVEEEAVVAAFPLPLGSSPSWAAVVVGASLLFGNAVVVDSKKDDHCCCCNFLRDHNYWERSFQILLCNCSRVVAGACRGGQNQCLSSRPVGAGPAGISAELPASAPPVIRAVHACWRSDCCRCLS